VSEGLLSGGSGSKKDIKLGDIPDDVLNDPLLQRVVKDEEGNPIPDMKTGKPMTETNWGEVSQIRDMMTQYGIRDWRQGVLLYKQSVLPQRIEQEWQERIQAVVEAGPEKARKLIEKMKPETRAQLVSELPDDFLSQVESSANKPSVNTDSRDPQERYSNATPEQIAESLRGKAPFLIDNHLRQLPQEKAERVRKMLNSKKAADPNSLKGSLENAGRKLGLLE
jgi:predicted unusual protein kinase regulating ubiquinone biosynthesis (AarF/ABC1/UbiB family)